MKLVIAYIRTDHAADVVRELYKGGVGGLTAYVVRGMSGETSTFLYSKRPFEINRLPESVKLEMVCPDESVEKILGLIAKGARTGEPGDGIIAVQDVQQLVRIRDIKL